MEISPKPASIIPGPVPAKAGIDRGAKQYFQRCGLIYDSKAPQWRHANPRFRGDRLQQEPRPLSDMAFAKVELFFVNSLAGRTVEKHAQNCGKNFPVNKTWVPAFFNISGSPFSWGQAWVLDQVGNDGRRFGGCFWNLANIFPSLYYLVPHFHGDKPRTPVREYGDWNDAMGDAFEPIRRTF